MTEDTPVVNDNAVDSAESFDAQRELMHRQMLSAVSHDLKTPLASVIGSLEIYHRMGAHLPEAKRATLIETALNEAYRLDSFLTNILDMAKLENNLVPFRSEEIDIRTLLENIVSALGQRTANAKIEIQPAQNFNVHLDIALASRALTLLVDNAVKHAGATPHVELNYSRARDMLIITIGDNGDGVPPGKEEEIFSKYSRLRRGDHQNAGTGLGLAIARHVARRLGGDVTVQNKPEGGALFTFTCHI